MLMDILIALAITIIAVVLGITVHPLLAFIVILAVVYFITRHRARTTHGYR